MRYTNIAPTINVMYILFCRSFSPTFSQHHAVSPTQSVSTGAGSSPTRSVAQGSAIEPRMVVMEKGEANGQSRLLLLGGVVLVVVLVAVAAGIS